MTSNLKPTSVDYLIMNLVEITEVCVKNHNIQLPKNFPGTELDNQRATSFYSALVTLAAAPKKTSAQGCITALMSIYHLNHPVAQGS